MAAFSPGRNRNHTLATTAILAIGGLITTGCETVANVAQNVADTARSRSGTSAPATPQPASAPAPTATAQAAPPAKAPPPESTKAEPCSANFVVTGTFIAGKQYKTQVPVPGVAPDVAYRKAHAGVVSQGWQVNSTDSTLRSISATQQVSFSRGGKTTPLNVLVQPATGGGSLVVMNYATAGGLHSPEDTVRDSFCQLAKHISR